MPSSPSSPAPELLATGALEISSTVSVAVLRPSAANWVVSAVSRLEALVRTPLVSVLTAVVAAAWSATMIDATTTTEPAVSVRLTAEAATPTSVASTALMAPCSVAP